MAGTAANPGLELAQRRVADLLEARLDEVTDELTDVFRASLPGYAALPRRVLRANTQTLLAKVPDLFRDDDRPREAYVTEMTALARRWTAEDLPLEAIARSFQIGAQHVLRVIHRHAAELELDADTVFLLQDAAWEWTTLVTSVLGDAQREEAVAAARRDATRRAAFLRDLASGVMTAERLAEEAPIYGVDLDAEYVTVCAAAPDAAAMTALESRIRASGSTSSHRVLQAGEPDVLLALAPQRPDAVAGATVAVGPPTRVAEARESFAEARQALATARAFDVTGVVDLASLGPLTLVTTGGRAARRLEAERFAGVGDAFGEIEHTVLTLLELDLSIEETAARLHLHRNTVRYRVGRFKDTTGLDVRRTRDLVTAWWLLKSRQARSRPPR